MSIEGNRSPSSSSSSRATGGNQSPSSSSSSRATGGNHIRRYAVEEECEDPASCTGKSCQSCTAGVIADCIAVCCCPCAVVNILTLTFFKLPYAVARKFIRRRKTKNKRKMLEGGKSGISGNGRAENGTWEIEVDDNLSAEFKVDDVWLELYEIGHLGFGRVSFSGNLFQNKGD